MGCAVLKELFQVRGWDENPHAQRYLTGLLGHCPRKNIERFRESQPEGQYEDMQYFLSDSLCHSLQDLAARQGQGYSVERAFEDGKSELGMADYQVRK